jgi:hypothetical protein
MAKSESAASTIAQVIDLIEKANEDEREKILRTISTYFGTPAGPLPNWQTRTTSPTVATEQGPQTPYSTSIDISPKQFLLEKRPNTDIERVACLAYYLTHSRGQAQFKTEDIGRLNIEAAQVRFSNPAQAVKNALRKGFLAEVSRGEKQLSAIGEQYVNALPDREAAGAVFDSMAPRRRRSNGDKAKRTGLEKEKASRGSRS